LARVVGDCRGRGRGVGRGDQLGVPVELPLLGGIAWRNGVLLEMFSSGRQIVSEGRRRNPGDENRSREGEPEDECGAA
jgi:hypothetical protein